MPKNMRMTSFSYRLFLSFFATAFLLLLIGLIILYTLSVKATKAINSQMTEKNLAITTQNINDAFNECGLAAQLAFTQKDVLKRSNAPYSFRSAQYNNIEHALVTSVSSFKAIDHISYCDTWGNIIATSTLSSTGIPYSSRENLLDYLNRYSVPTHCNDQDWYFLSPDLIQPDKYCIVNVRNISLINNGICEPLLAISVSEDFISSIYDFLGPNTFIMTANGLIISAVDKNVIGETVDISLYVKDASHQITSTVVGGQNLRYTSYLSSIDGYVVIETSTEALRSTTYIVTLGAISIVLVGLLLSITWSQYAAKALTEPLKKTKACIEQIRGGDLDVRCDVVHHDEIGYLAESFNQMMDSLQQHIQQLNEEQHRATDNELRLLHSQINPHLLYNSLDSALFLMSQNDTEKSIRILEELSNFFKKSLQRGNKIITLNSALALVESYIQLQNLCRSKDFKLQVTGDAQLRTAPILHMVLQPVVENCVLHGFCGTFSDGLIEISYSLQNSFLVIIVTDNGVGMDDETLKILRTALQSNSAPVNSFGLWNVAQRLRMYYGNASQIDVDSELGEYTSVKIRIPFKPTGHLEENQYV